MGLFDKIKEPIFLKDNSAAKEQLAQLEALQTNDEAIKKLIQKDIMLLKYGIAGFIFRTQWFDGSIRLCDCDERAHVYFGM